jgi:hypothetical protein
MASLAEVLVTASDSLFLGSKHPQVDSFDKLGSIEKQFAMSLEGNKFSRNSELTYAAKCAMILQQLVPFYEIYFNKYSFSKKLIVCLSIDKSGLYHEGLFSEFFRDLETRLGPEGEGMDEVE